MVIIRNDEMCVVRTSKNLRGIMVHSRQNKVRLVHLFECKGGSSALVVTWANGDTCTTDFADFSVLCDWVKRRRMFEGVGKQFTFAIEGR